MIAVFTSNKDGGLLQLAISITKEFLQMGEEIITFVPKDANVWIENIVEERIFRYEKTRSICLKNHSTDVIVEKIRQKNISTIVFIEDSVLAYQLLMRLGQIWRNEIKQFLIIHDPEQHPTNHKKTLSQYAQVLYVKQLAQICNKFITKFVFMSKVSEKKYVQLNPRMKERTLVINLGAHMPACEAKKPAEIEAMSNRYVLFFGRIDKYKGISTALEVFKKYNGNDIRLVIAGKGTLTKEESDILSGMSNVLCINRYIADEEMSWLFRNAIALILPYIEASQSGIIPIAYSLGKPVIVSNVTGLTQFVEDGETGYVCKTISEYIDAISEVLSAGPEYYKMKCILYYQNNMSWEKNLCKLIYS